MEMRSTKTSSLFFLGMLAFVAALSGGAATKVYSSQQETKDTLSTMHRTHSHPGSALIETNPIPSMRNGRAQKRCRKSDIEIQQGPTEPLPSGIPTYTVEITNICGNGCSVSNIHIACGKFSSARLINPKIFKRLRYNDCLVNGGKPLANGHTISFKYANTYPYALSVSSAACS